MKYIIEQYIKKLCSDAVINLSDSAESIYYNMGHNFIVRLSSHTGMLGKSSTSVVKSFNTDDFIIMIDKTPYPLIKVQKEYRGLIRVGYEMSTLKELAEKHVKEKKEMDIEGLTDWVLFCGIRFVLNFLLVII